MKSLSKTLVAVSLCVMAVSPAFASHDEEYTGKRNHVEQRKDSSRHHVHDVVKQQRPIRHDANSHEQERRELRQLTRRFYRDGYLSEKERRILNRKLHALDLPVKQHSPRRLGKYVDLHHRYGHHERVCNL